MSQTTDHSTPMCQGAADHPVLSEQSIAGIAGGVAVPSYDRAQCLTGIVHLGPGAFHRAHQAVFVDDVLARGDKQWAICGVSLHSSKVRDALAAQDNLYTLAILDESIQFRVIGSIRELLLATGQAATVIRRLASPASKIVTLTITEKGYCLTPSGDLNEEHPDIRHDLLNPQAPVSAIGFLVEGLRQRRAAGIASFTALSCDNLTDNGKRLARAVVQYAGLLDPELARWIENETRFPNSMVDSITPATDDLLRSRVEQASGLTDTWPIQREAFSQWVVEDRFACGRPSWEDAGVTMTGDVEPFEQAKLRLLNGPHSTMAYLGTLCGYQTVAEVAGDADFMAHLKNMMREEIKPGLGKMPLNLDQYIDSVLSRFRNSTISHQLLQIAWDGSQKLPFRILGTVQDNLAQGQGIERLCLTVAAWFHFIRQRVRDGHEIIDPLAPALERIGSLCTGNTQTDIAHFGELDGVFDPVLYRESRFHRLLCRSYGMIETLGARGAVAQMLSEV